MKSKERVYPKIDREAIKAKYGGLCAYSGTPLKDDWQIDHIIPKATKLKAYHNIKNHNDPENLMPVQRIINHYKRSLSLSDFKSWYLGELHLRLKKLPKTTNSPTAIEHKRYLLEVAELFEITIDKPFGGKLYFETITL
jgi:5-methylcytosine-specific restriction endonuclease McrA